MLTQKEMRRIHKATETHMVSVPHPFDPEARILLRCSRVPYRKWARRKVNLDFQGEKLSPKLASIVGA